MCVGILKQQSNLKNVKFLTLVIYQFKIINQELETLLDVASVYLRENGGKPFQGHCHLSQSWHGYGALHESVGDKMSSFLKMTSTILPHTHTKLSLLQQGRGFFVG